MDVNFKLKEELASYFKERAKSKEKLFTIISAYKLSEKDLNQIRKVLSIPTDFNVVNTVDSGVLGGLVIKLGSKLIDLSIGGQLKKIRKLVELIP